MRNQDELISVIIPVYNVEEYLGRCLDSIINNTYKHLEIICINDGSTDNCKKILEEYKKRDSRIIIVNKDNGGLSSARNCGLRIARGEYVSFIDSDDWIHSYYFEYLLKAIREYKADMSVCEFMHATDDDILPEGNYKAHPVTISYLVKNNRYNSYVWRRLIRHEILDDLFFDEKLKIEDADYLARLFAGKPNIKAVAVEMVLYAYYKRKGSLVSALDLEDYLLVAESIAKQIDMTDSQIIKKILAENVIKRALSCRFTYITTKDKEKIHRSNLLILKGLLYVHSLKYYIFSLFPSLYRFLLTRKDPSMKAFEDRLKEEYKHSYKCN